MSDRAVPVGGPIMTRAFKILLGVGLLGLVLTIWRFAAGLGATTGLSDGYPWGLWIAFDVVTGTALACGGYAVAILVYILNKGRYHPLIRPAVLTSALGYTVAAVAIMVDVGRPWFIYRIPIRVGQWNLNSALLEVALCVMAYVAVLWIELAPAFLEKLQESRSAFISRTAGTLNRIISKGLIWILALGMLLPTMHQSSLGTVMLLAGPKLHPLWRSPLLPLLFLMSCIAMGYAVVVMESTLSSRAFHRATEKRVLASLSVAMVPLLFGYVIIRVLDVALRGDLGMVLAFDQYSFWFLLELALFLVPAVMLLSSRRRSNPGQLFRAAMLMILGGALYRFDTYLVAFRPGQNWSYFPAVPEILITVGIVAAEIMAYLIIVKRFPILSGAAPSASES